MIDLPEVRQLLRDNNLYSARAQRLNRKGQLPTQLRHAIKAEDSNEDTEDDEKYDQQEKQLWNAGNDAVLAIVGQVMEAPLECQMNKSQKEVEELLVINKIADENDPYRLKYNKSLTIKQKLAHYKTPDYCIVTRADTL